MISCLLVKKPENLLSLSTVQSLDRKGLLYLDRSFRVRRAHTELCDFFVYLCVFVLGTLIYDTGTYSTVIGYNSMWNKN